MTYIEVIEDAFTSFIKGDAIHTEVVGERREGEAEENCYRLDCYTFHKHVT